LYKYVFHFRALVIFGLNALAGRSIQVDGSAAGAWDSSNAESFIRYTVEKGYAIHGWELGTANSLAILINCQASSSMIVQLNREFFVNTVSFMWMLFLLGARK